MTDHAITLTVTDAAVKKLGRTLVHFAVTGTAPRPLEEFAGRILIALKDGKPDCYICLKEENGDK